LASASAAINRLFKALGKLAFRLFPACLDDQLGWHVSPVEQR